MVSTSSSTGGDGGPPDYVEYGQDGEMPGYGGSGGYGGDSPWADFSVPEVTTTDTVLAWVKLVIAIFFLTVGTATIVKFYQCRYILDIRTRSVHLVVLTGIVLNLTFLVAMNTSCRILWGKSLRWFWSSLVLFFVLPVYSGCYISRSIRLAVVFHPRAKHALRWLIPERNHIIILLLLGVCFTAIPIYHELTQEVWEIIPLQLDLLENTSLGLAVVLAALYPLIRNVDDMFNIGKELMFVMASLVSTAVLGKLTVKFENESITRWIGTGNLSFFVTVTVFCISVVEPMFKLAFDPLAASKRSYASRVILSRAQARYSNSHSTTSIGSTPGDMVAVMEVKTQEEADTWNFERLASTPMLASAFEDFARKALCHESVMFLEHASRYRGGDYSFANTRGVWALEYEGFRAIVNTYVCPGSPEEINISSADRKRIVDVFNGGRAVFSRLPDEERRLIFGQAYREVVDMLEANLLQRFMQTEEFQQVKSQRETVQVMMESPEMTADLAEYGTSK